MQLTPNYNLKKPEGTDPVDIQDFNDNADILDAELNKKADSTGGDISNMTIKALEEPAGTQFPVPEAGETSKSFLGKIRKFMNDFKSWNTGVCMIGQIVNNCVTNNDKLPLSAAQGKVLMDLYSVLNTNFDIKRYALSEGVTAYKYGKVIYISIFENFVTANTDGEYTLPEDIIPIDTIRTLIYGSPSGAGADTYIAMWCVKDSTSLLWGSNGQVVTSLRGLITYLCK